MRRSQEHLESKRSKRVNRIVSTLFLILMLPRVHASQQPAPDLSLIDIDGTRFSIGEFKGRPVLIDFMATWCKPCADQMPNLVELSKEYGERIVIVSISVDPVFDTEGRLRQFRSKFGADWRFARGDSNLVLAYQVALIPLYMVIDGDGHVVSRLVISPSYSDFRAALARAGAGDVQGEHPWIPALGYAAALGLLAILAFVLSKTSLRWFLRRRQPMTLAIKRLSNAQLLMVVFWFR